MAVREYLERLIHEKNWGEALRAAEQFAPLQDQPPETMAWIQFALAAGRIYHRQDYVGGLEPAYKAAQRARALNLIPLYGRALADLSLALLHTGQNERVLRCCVEILRHTWEYGADRQWLRAVALHNIAFVQRKRQRFDLALPAFERAARAYAAAGRADRSFVARGFQVVCAVEGQQLGRVPALLKDLWQWIRLHHLGQDAGAWYLYYSALHQLGKGQYGRATDLALKALAHPPPKDDMAFCAHIVLYRCAQHFGEHADALGHALAARMASIESKRLDQQLEAVAAINAVIRSQGPAVVHELDCRYRKIGLDLSQFLSERVLPVRLPLAAGGSGAVGVPLPAGAPPALALS